MDRKKLVQLLSKALIYLVSISMVFVFVFFYSDARAYSAGMPESQPAAAFSSSEAQSLPPEVERALAASSQPAETDDSLPAEGADSVTSDDETNGDASSNTPDADDDEMVLSEDILAAEVGRITAMGIELPVMMEPRYFGEFHTTAYCCEVYPHICGGNGVTASGTVPTPGLTCAADWSVLPPGSWIYIADVGMRRVEDSGSAIKQKRLDVAVDTHDNALRWPGFGRHDVWVLYVPLRSAK